MNLLELSKYLQDEQAAENYLYEKGILKRFTHCPYCDSEKIGHIRRERIKCYGCKKEWHKRKDSFLEGRHISSATFIGLIKLFVDNYGITEISDELSLDRKTTQDLHSDLISLLINAHEIDNFDLAKPSILYIKNNQQVHLVESEEFYNSTDSAKSYLKISFDRYKSVGGLYSFLINAQFVGTKKQQQKLNNFLSFAKMRLINYRGIKHEKLFDYLIETIIRFNLRDEDFFQYLINKLNF